MTFGKNERHSCIINVGLFRSGTTTLYKAAKGLGLNPDRTFPDISAEQFKGFLLEPEAMILHWFHSGGLEELVRRASTHDLLCDGWFALLPFLPPSTLDRIKNEAKRLAGVDVQFVATTRDVESTVKSELQHWTVHGIEQRAKLDPSERRNLESALRERAAKHETAVRQLHEFGALQLLPLSHDWSKTLSSVTDFNKDDWSRAIKRSGIQNANPPLPVEGVLLTLRLEADNDVATHKKIDSVERLLNQIEEDSLCCYLVVLAIDKDEEGCDAAKELVRRLHLRTEQRRHLQSLHLVINPTKRKDHAFAICSVWDEMAAVAWEAGADWVVLLGDDVQIDCPYHYRAFYHSFLEISENLKVPFGFGCPWWNDRTFPGFPSFPCVGKTHFELFGGLIPQHRRSSFVNQDLDPYLHYLYLKFKAAPCVTEALLSNESGGNIGCSDARYERVPTPEWRDFITEDVGPIRMYLPSDVPEAILLDVVVPSYRVQLDYLQSICFLRVPQQIRTLFIIIIDNPNALLRWAADRIDERIDRMTLERGERLLEEVLSQTGNQVRVRCNKTNVGASASRNRGLDESAAEYVLNLDDDLIPNPDLLEQYGRKLREIDDDVVGLIGLVRFPRSPTLPLRHAAVLMSYLTFMFEIAERSDMYKPAAPAWGVTANILFRRTKVRFDLAYAKTGGGEDVDFSLRVAAEASCTGGRLMAAPEACVVHPFWPGSVFTLCSHFFNWAIGDGSLFKRFPKYRYWSYPNAPETLLIASPLLFRLGPWTATKVALLCVVADLMVDCCCYPGEYKHRCLMLQSPGDHAQKQERSPLFYLCAHALANFYVLVLESGRLWGHIVARREPWHGLCRRFDWHCGRLKNAPKNFRQREAYKFGLFLGVLAWHFSHPR